jgi:alanine racemase
MHTSWIEVNISALRHNLAQVRGLVGSRVKVMAVVKADAYGHGAVGTARVFADSKANYLGVTTLEEGLELRSAGISLPILVFSPLLPDQIEAAIESDLELTICDMASGEAVAKAVQCTGKRARFHLKIDTGMGRLGAEPEDCPGLMYSLLQLGGLEVAGVYTHFANASTRDLADARKQNSAFSAALVSLQSKDIPTGLCHASNSAATLNLPEARYDMIRTGTLLYGQYPSPALAKSLPDLQETWRLKTRVTSIRKFPAGASIGYGSEFTTRRPTTAAVLPVGYAEGFTMIPGSLARRSSGVVRAIATRLVKGADAPYVVVRGKRVPVIGRISMQMCSVDVTGIPDIHPGEEVIVPCRRLSASSRLPRVYAESPVASDQ